MKKTFTIKLHQAWKEVKAYQKRWEGKLYGTNKPFATYGDFKEYVKSGLTNQKGKLMESKLTKGFIHQTKMQLRYKVSAKVARNIYEINREMGVYAGEVGELRKKDTTTLANMIKDEIKDYYAIRKKELAGVDNYSEIIKNEIGEMYFGS